MKCFVDISGLEPGPGLFDGSTFCKIRTIKVCKILIKERSGFLGLGAIYVLGKHKSKGMHEICAQCPSFTWKS